MSRLTNVDALMVLAASIHPQRRHVTADPTFRVFSEH